MSDVVIVDYGSGNVRSLRAALERAGAKVVVSGDPSIVAGARRLMVPGQGAAGPAIATLRGTGLERAIRDALTSGAYLLGVCVGLQLLFDTSEEQDATGLGLIQGRVTRLAGISRLPHMGWNDVTPVGAPHPLAAGLPACAYFAHSYAILDPGPSTVATTEVDGITFASIVAAGRVAGAQFHPERSSDAGRAMLGAFLEWSDAA